MKKKPNLKDVSDDELLRRLSEILKQSRRVEADLIAHIGEVDARRLYAREAAPSMFMYCTKVLHLSEPEAALRIRVARAARRHPMLLRMLRDGGLHLSGIALLAPLLTVENRRTLLKRAVHRSKRQIEELVAELRPVPDAPTLVRKLPTRRENAPGPAPHAVGPNAPGLLDSPQRLEELVSSPVLQAPRPAALSAEPSLDAVAPLPGRQRPDAVVPVTPHQATPSGPEQRPDAVAAPHSHPAPDPERGRSAYVPQPMRATSVEPLAPARYKFQFTAGVELRDKLERLQALMRFSVPDGDLAKLIELAVTEKLERLEARRFAKTKEPRKSLAKTDTRPKSRHIPAAVRRTVYERDKGLCTYVDTHGRRCETDERLEFHHHGRPFGKGGDHSPENIRLMCRIHNALMAEQDYGKEVMARFWRSGSRVSEGVAVYGAGLSLSAARLPPRCWRAGVLGWSPRAGFDHRKLSSSIRS